MAYRLGWVLYWTCLVLAAVWLFFYVANHGTFLTPRNLVLLALQNSIVVSDTEMRRRCSSGSKSETVEPSSTRPIRLVAPAANKSASVRDVLPEPPWPTSRTW